MPRILHSQLAREKNRQYSDHVFTMAFELTIQGAPTVLRFVNYDQDILFHGVPYVRMPIDVDMLEEATSANLVHLRAQVQNVTRELSALLENYWIVDPRWTVSIWQIDATQPDLTPLTDGQFFVVQSVVVDPVVAVFDLVAEGYTLSRTLPGRRYTSTSGFDKLVRR